MSADEDSPPPFENPDGRHRRLAAVLLAQATEVEPSKDDWLWKDSSYGGPVEGSNLRDLLEAIDTVGADRVALFYDDQGMGLMLREEAELAKAEPDAFIVVPGRDGSFRVELRAGVSLAAPGFTPETYEGPKAQEMATARATILSSCAQSIITDDKEAS